MSAPPSASASAASSALVGGKDAPGVVPRSKYKLVFLGDESVGKTSIIARFMNDTFESSYSATVGIDFLSKTMYLEDRIVRLQLWDTAGQERFRSLIPSYIRDCAVAIIAYDISSCVLAVWCFGAPCLPFSTMFEMRWASVATRFRLLTFNFGLAFHINHFVSLHGTRTRRPTNSQTARHSSIRTSGSTMCEQSAATRSLSCSSAIKQISRKRGTVDLQFALHFTCYCGLMYSWSLPSQCFVVLPFHAHEAHARPLTLTRTHNAQTRTHHARRQVSVEEGEARAKALDVLFVETSARAGYNIKALFRKVALALPGMDAAQLPAEGMCVGVRCVLCVLCVLCSVSAPAGARACV
jgi:GTPase SAR1 family protein